MADMTSEKVIVSDDIKSEAVPSNDVASTKEATIEAHEVFRQVDEGVNFRTLSWTRAAVLMIKLNFAISMLSIPSLFGQLGAVGGSLSVVGWNIMNTYTAMLIGNFRNNHPECHTLADMGGVMWGPIGKEIVGVMVLVAQVLYTSGGIISLATGLNALSGHTLCTVYFTLISCIMVAVFSSIRTFSRLGWITWFTFTTFFISVFIFVIAVSRADRPFAAPKEGPYELGYYNIRHPSFSTGMTATANIFLSGSAGSMYPSIIAEMRRPQDFRKAVLTNGVVVGAVYLTFSIVIYRYCGQWITSPAFGSAGTIIMKLCYGIAMPGLVIGNSLYQHVAAKYLFVRILRNTQHLQKGSLIHWSTWLGINFVLCVAIFIVSEAIPVLNYLLGFAGSLCSGPFCLVFPPLFWYYDYKRRAHKGLKDHILLPFNVFVFCLGIFVVVGGTYGTALGLKAAYANGTISKIFDCADNSKVIVG